MILGSADIAAMKVGTGSVSKVYLGTEQVWPSGFDPLTLSPVMWLDASDASTLFNATSGGSMVSADETVVRWEDKSGNGNHGNEISPVPETRPVRRVGYRNGLDALEFPLNGGIPTILNLQRPYSIVFAGRQRAATGAARMISSGSINGLISITRPSFCVFTDALIRSAAIDGGAGAAGEAVVTLMVSDVAATTLHKNGGTNIADASPASTNWGQVNIGTKSGEGVDGWMFEVFAFDRTLTLEERGLLEAYLMDKWAIS